jgi:HTH-type transcriptional regulator, transcriptional repressor of NAD biosynthesis genes
MIATRPPYRHALVVGKFAPLHRGHEHLLNEALRIADDITVVVWANPDFASMPNAVRAAWISRRFSTATVLIGADGPSDDEPELHHRVYVRDLLRRHGRHPDVVLTSEAYGEPFAAVLGIDHVLVDIDRSTVPVSGSMIRADVHAHRQFLDPIVAAHFVERVVLLGAESTGKTTLAALLADRFHTAWVPEYGREYYEERGGELGLDDYVVIAHRHREREDAAALHANRYLFCDTNAITTMFFSHYYNRDSRPELHRLADECADRYAHVFVCDDDIAFEQDGWRDSVEWRTRMQGMVIHDLRVRRIPFTLVRGTPADRLATAAAALQRTTPSTDATASERASAGPRPMPS